MNYRRLGNSGLKVSELSFGSWVTFVNQLTEKTALSCMSMAYENGVNFFDNAEAYANGKSEKLMGNIIKKLKWTRDTYIVSSKVFWGGEFRTDGYFVNTVGQHTNEEIISTYVLNRGTEKDYMQLHRVPRQIENH